MKRDVSFELVEMVFDISRLMRGQMSYTGNLTHLSVLQIQALMFIGQHKKVSMTDIAEYFHIELPSATSLLNKLCDQKFVKRHEDKKDRRLVRVVLTRKGKTTLKQAMAGRRKRFEQLLSYLSKKEKNELRKILKTLYSKLQK